MTLLDVSSCAQTSALFGRLQVSPAKQTPSSSFWSSCAANLYTTPQCLLTSSTAASQSTQPRSVTAQSCSVHGFDRPLTQAPRTSHLNGLPCPVLYQAKEPEAISDVLRRAGKKALGGGIPGIDLTCPRPLSLGTEQLWRCYLMWQRDVAFLCAVGSVLYRHLWQADKASASRPIA